MPTSITPSLLLFTLIGVLALLGIVYALFSRHRRKVAARLEAQETAERRAARQARRQARRATREQDIAEAQKARQRGDRRPVVLVVDDSRTVVESIKRSLEDRQYRVVIAGHGRDAWATLQDIKPDIVVSDIEMPHLDGLALLRLIRSDMELANLPVILMSANAAAMIEAGKQDGVSGLLAKPFEDRDLVGQIKFLLQEN